MQFNFGYSPSTILTLTITMTDIAGDGWNGNVLAIKQNNIIIGTFGSAFTSKNVSGPVTITVKGTSKPKLWCTSLEIKQMR